MKFLFTDIRRQWRIAWIQTAFLLVMIMSVMVKLANVIQVIVQDWSLIRVDSEYTGGYKSDKCWKSLGKDDRTDVQYKNKNSGKKKRLTIEHCDYDATVKLQNSNCGNTVQINVLYWVVQHSIRGICDLFQEFKKQSGIETSRLIWFHCLFLCCW